jgi:pimeloyl-ACP methyl ester carboxylesterase
MRHIVVLGSLVLVSLAACGDTASVVEPDPNATVDGGETTRPDGSTLPGPDGSSPGDGSTTGDSGTALDPNLPGPYTTASSDATITPGTGDRLPMHVVYPNGLAGPLPVVIIAHGFQLSIDLYYGYAERLATHGFLAVVPDYPTGFGANNVKDAQNLIAALDWSLTSAPVKGDATKAGVMGHSRGGKAAILAAARDPRFKALMGLDPVDSKPGGFINCDTTTECPPATGELAKVNAPVLFLGETLDATAGAFGQACAPADLNFAILYGAAKSPAISVDVAGAGHMSFLDNPNCAIFCGQCKTPTAKSADVLALARAYTAAFFVRHLQGNAAMDAYITGAQAQARYVTPKVATIQSK